MGKEPVTQAAGEHLTGSKRLFDAPVGLLEISPAYATRDFHRLPLDQADNGSWIILMSTSCSPAAVIRLASLEATLKSLRSSNARI